MAKGFLIAALNFADVPGHEFHEWQDQEHIPERLAVPGFINAQRWIGADDPKISVNTYDLESLEVLKAPEYLAFSYENSSAWSKRVIGNCKRLMRVAADQIAPGDAIQPEGAGALLFNALNILAEHDAEFHAWYTQEHLPALATVPGTLCARFFRSGDTRSTHRYLAAYHLTTTDVPDSSAWRKAADTPWSARVRPHFRDRVRIICRRYAPAE